MERRSSLLANSKLPGDKWVAADKVAAIVSIAVFVSGFTAISYEIVWQRLLVRTTGATLPAVSVIFTIFIAGLWAGYLASVPLVRRAETPLRIYAFIEMAIAGFAIAIPTLFSEKCSAPVLAGLTSSLQALSGQASDQCQSQAALIQDALYLLILFLPAGLMGLTFNCLTKFVYKRTADFSFAAAQMSRCYALNIAGGAVGCCLTAFFLIPNVGLATTSMVMSLLNVIVFVMLLACSLMVQPNLDPFDLLRNMFSPPPGEDDSSAADFSDVPAECEDSLLQTNRLPQMLSVAFASSLAIMVLEVCFTRLLMLVLGSSTYSISAVLLMVFVGFALAAGAVSSKMVQSVVLDNLIPVSLLLASFFVSTVMWLIPDMPLTLMTLQQLLLNATGDHTASFLLPRFLICSILVLPAFSLLGTVFPVLLRLACSRQSLAGSADTGVWQPSSSLASLFAASSAGSICGALMAGFLLIPHPIKEYIGTGTASGIESTLLLVALFLLALSLVLIGMAGIDKQAAPNGRSIRPVIFASLAIGTLLSISLRPSWNLQLLTLGPSFYHLAAGTRLSQAKLLKAIGDTAGGGAGLLYYREGLNQTVSVEENKAGNVRFLKNDGKTEAALPLDWRLPCRTSDAPTHIVLGTLPFYFADKHSNLSSLVVGLGTGITSGAALCSPQVSRVQVAELEPAVKEASALFEPGNFSPLRNRDRLSAAQLSIVDGRNLLRCSDTNYDVIVSQPCEPWISGASDLFTAEFFHLTSRRLNPGGVMCQWLQLYSIDRQSLKTLLATFRDSYPDCALIHVAGAGEVLLIGKKYAAEGLYKTGDVMRKSDLDVASINAYLHESLLPLESALSSAVGASIKVPPLQCDFVLPSSALARLTDGAKLNTDDRLRSEYTFAAALVDPDDNVTSNLHWLQSK